MTERYPWTADDHAAICADRGKLSASIIAELYGVSRNAIIGIWSRNRQLWPGGQLEGTNPPRTVVNTIVRAPKKAAKAEPPAPVRRPKLKVSPAPRQTVEPKYGGAAEAVYGLTLDTCRWPIGHPKASDFRFCCDPVQAGKVYCPEHCGMAFSAVMSRAWPGPRPGNADTLRMPGADT